MARRQAQAHLGDRREHLGPEHLGQGLMAEQVTGFALVGVGAPHPLLGIDSGGRHDQMDVGMVVQAAGMGVQDGNRPGRALQVLVVEAEGPHRLPGALDERAIERALMGEGEGAKLRRQGERQQEVLARHQGLELALQPLLAFVMLAVRTGAVAAGMGHKHPLLAGEAVRLHAGAEGVAAGLHGRERLALLGQQLIGVLGQQRCFELLDERGQAHHFTPPQVMAKPSIKELIRVVALCPVPVVRWVYLAVVRIKW